MEIKVEFGPDAGKVFRATKDKIVVGRDSGCDCVITSDPTLSRKHAEISLSQNQLIVTDLSSTSGTFLNQIRLTPFASHPYRPGDQLSMGQSVISIKLITDDLQPTAASQPPVQTQTHTPSNCCNSCGSKFSLLGQGAKSQRFPGMCNSCAKALLVKVDAFRAKLNGTFSLWNQSYTALATVIDQLASSCQIDKSFGLSQSADICTNFLQRILTFLLQDGALSIQEESTFRQYMLVLNLSEAHLPNISQQLQHYVFLRNIGEGKLPTTRSHVLMPVDEIAHYQTPAAYYRELTASTRVHPGLLIVTNRRIIFTETDHPFEFQLSKVLGATYHAPKHFQIQLSRKQGSGYYESTNAFYATEIIQAAVNIHLRNMIVQQSSSRAIPQDIKAQVWQRDSGRCVQCASQEYLEFDHIIPFSKGGATSINNLQLLCRRCNLGKGSRI